MSVCCFRIEYVSNQHIFVTKFVHKYFTVYLHMYYCRVYLLVYRVSKMVYYILLYFFPRQKRNISIATCVVIVEKLIVCRLVNIGIFSI